MSHESTLDHYRQTYQPGGVFEHLMKSQWSEKGCQTLRERVREIVQTRLKQWDFELEGSKKRELGRIYEAARKRRR